MSKATPSLIEFLDTLPPATDLREKINANIRERELLRRLLKIAERRDRISSTKSEARR